MFQRMLVAISLIFPSCVALHCYCDTNPPKGMKDIADELQNVHQMPKCEGGSCVAALPQLFSAEDGFEPACTKFANETDFYHACYMQKVGTTCGKFADTEVTMCHCTDKDKCNKDLKVSDALIRYPTLECLCDTEIPESLKLAAMYVEAESDRSGGVCKEGKCKTHLPNGEEKMFPACVIFSSGSHSYRACTLIDHAKCEHDKIVDAYACYCAGLNFCNEQLNDTAEILTTTANPKLQSIVSQPDRKYHSDWNITKNSASCLIWSGGLAIYSFIFILVNFNLPVCIVNFI